MATAGEGAGGRSIWRGRGRREDGALKSSSFSHIHKVRGGAILEAGTEPLASGGGQQDTVVGEPVRSPAHGVAAGRAIQDGTTRGFPAANQPDGDGNVELKMLGQ